MTLDELAAACDRAAARGQRLIMFTVRRPCIDSTVRLMKNRGPCSDEVVWSTDAYTIACWSIDKIRKFVRREQRKSRR